MKTIYLKSIFLLSFALSAASTVSAQQLPIRYLDVITDNVVVTKDVTFSTNIPTVKVTDLAGNKIANENTFGQRIVNLKMDIYRPANDAVTNRPVIIFAFGGAFINGDKSNEGMIALAREFAKRGYVTASMNYRLGMNVTDKELSKRAVYRALQDGRSAVRFFRRNAAAYGVDANKVFLGGQSSGALLALHSVFIDKDSERPASTRNYEGRLDLGGLESIGDNKTYSNGTLVDGKANAVVAFAGSLGETSYIEGATDVPTVYFHSTDDRIMPYNSGEPFTDFNWIPGFNLPIVYGSNRLAMRSASVAAPYTLYTYTTRGHAVHFDGRARNLYTDIAPRAAEFLYNRVLNATPSANRSNESNALDSSKALTLSASYSATNDKVAVTLSGDYRGRIQLALYDSAGELYFSENGVKNNGTDNQMINVTSLTNGTYYVSVINERGKETIKEVLVAGKQY
jgi:acetyl esterase/lipase